MQIVSSKTALTVCVVLNNIIVTKNNQNRGELNMSTSSISFPETVPGMNSRTPITRHTMIMLKINTDLRHLYLSVTAPTTGRISKPESGSTVNIKPTRADE